MHGVYDTYKPHFQNQFATTSSSLFVLWRRVCWGANQRAGQLRHDNQGRVVEGVRVDVWSRVWTRCSVCGVSMWSSSGVRMGWSCGRGIGFGSWWFTVYWERERAVALSGGMCRQRNSKSGHCEFEPVSSKWFYDIIILLGAGVSWTEPVWHLQKGGFRGHWRHNRQTMSKLGLNFGQ